MSNCRVCNKPLFSKPLLTYPGMPDRAQYLSAMPTGDSVTLYVCQCSGCGLIQLDIEPVQYWREEISNAEMSAEMRVVRQQRLKEFKDVTGRNAPDFTSYNRLEHLPDPNGYLSQFQGYGIVEVPNFDMMVRKGLFYEFIRDHLMYFTSGTLSFALRFNGFKVMQMLAIQGDYILSAIVCRRTPDTWLPRRMNQDAMSASMKDVLAAHQHVAVYGASHQAFTILPMLGVADRIWYIVDDTPAKQKKFAPATRIAISHPDRLQSDKVDAVIVMCGSYSHEVAKRLTHKNVYVLTPGGVERYESV